MVGLANDWSNGVGDAAIQRGGECFRRSAVVEVLIDLSNSTQLGFLQEIQVLFLVSRAVLLHGQQSCIVFLGFLEVVPVVEAEPVGFIICQVFDELLQVFEEDEADSILALGTDQKMREISDEIVDKSAEVKLVD